MYENKVVDLCKYIEKNIELANLLNTQGAGIVYYNSCTGLHSSFSRVFDGGYIDIDVELFMRLLAYYCNQSKNDRRLFIVKKCFIIARTLIDLGYITKEDLLSSKYTPLFKKEKIFTDIKNSEIFDARFNLNSWNNPEACAKYEKEIEYLANIKEKYGEKFLCDIYNEFMRKKLNRSTYHCITYEVVTPNDIISFCDEVKKEVNKLISIDQKNAVLELWKDPAVVEKYQEENKYLEFVISSIGVDLFNSILSLKCFGDDSSKYSVADITPQNIVDIVSKLQYEFERLSQLPKKVRRKKSGSENDSVITESSPIVIQKSMIKHGSYFESDGKVFIISE